MTRTRKEVIAGARAKAVDQLIAGIQAGTGRFIGERKTECISFHPMKPKWEKYGKWFTTIASDGDVKFINGRIVEPKMLQLFYVVLDCGTVVEQLVWERPDLTFNAGRSIMGESMSIGIK